MSKQILAPTLLILFCGTLIVFSSEIYGAIYQAFVSEKIELEEAADDELKRLIKNKVVPEFFPSQFSKFSMQIDWDTFQRCGQFQLPREDLRAFEKNLLKNGYRQHSESLKLPEITLSILHQCTELKAVSSDYTRIYKAAENSPIHLIFIVDSKDGFVSFRGN